MKVVWKYPLNVGVNTIKLPRGSIPLTVQYQSPDMQLWVLVPDADAPLEDLVLRVIGTGHVITGRVGAYVATVQITDGPAAGTVWHAFLGTEVQS